MKTKQIPNKPDLIIASKRDSKIFFDALMNPAKPNEALVKAAREYKERLGEKTSL